MLATHSFPPSYTQEPPHNFLPAIPSPLSPRSANIYGRRTALMLCSETPEKPGKVASVPFAKRAVKKAPAQSQDALKERRRNIFLRKVKEGREDRRFHARGDDIMHLDFVQRQKQWEAEQARSAAQLPSDVPEAEDEEEEAEDCELPTSSNPMQLSSQPHASEEEADEVARREAEELETLLSLMGQDGGNESEAMEDNSKQSQHLWSDDDDYDALFEQLVDQEGSSAPLTQVEDHGLAEGEGGDAMDVS